MTHSVSHSLAVRYNNVLPRPCGVICCQGRSKWMTTSLLFMHPNSLLSHCLERTRHLFIIYGCKRERNAPICFFTPRNLASRRTRLEDGPCLTACIFNRSIINRCFAVWDAWFMQAICDVGLLQWKRENWGSISEGTGLGCTIGYCAGESLDSNIRDFAVNAPLSDTN